MKFKSCRWRCAPEDGEFCTHRDVLPFAGKNDFKADSWCPECAFYKLRRTPKKRELGLPTAIDYSIQPTEFRTEWQLGFGIRSLYSLNSRANSIHSPSGASSWYARQCGFASGECPVFSSVTAR